MDTDNGPRNGCFDRKPLDEFVWVQNGWEFKHKHFLHGSGMTRIPKMVKIANPNTKNCQYSVLTQADPRCRGCVHHVKGFK